MTRDELEALVAELGSAEEGSRELSAEVLRASGWVWRDDGYLEMPNGRYWGPGPHPSPTESVDAALQLVPEGMRWWVSDTGAGVGFPGVKGKWWESENSNDPACALSEAICRARLREGE